MEEIIVRCTAQPAYEPGENQVPILLCPPHISAISPLTNTVPINYNAKLSGNRSFNIGAALNNITAGIEYRLIGNNGREGYMTLHVLRFR